MSEIFSRVSHEFFRSPEYRKIQSLNNDYAKSLALFLLNCPNLHNFTGYGTVTYDYLRLHWFRFSNDRLISELKELEKIEFLTFDYETYECLVPFKVKQTLGYSFNLKNAFTLTVLKEIDKLPARYIVFLYDSLWEYFKDNGICLWVSLPSCEKKVASFYFSKNEEQEIIYVKYF